MRGGVPDDRQALAARGEDGLDPVAVGELGGQVDGGAVDSHGDDGRVVAEEVQTRGPPVDRPGLLPGIADDDD